jgi:autotransporter-associated beta strand protein
MTTANRVIEVSGAGSVLEFATADTMGAFGYASPVLLVASDGGVITRTANAFNSIGSVLLDNGGILRANAGQNATVQSFSINGNVTVTGTDAGGTIEALDGANNGIHLRSTGSSGNVTFDVADTAAEVDLLVSARLINPVQVSFLGYNAAGTTAGIRKTGAGTMSLTAANTYSGGTNVLEGTLVFGVAGALGSGAVTLTGGELNLGGLTLTNAITANGGALSGDGTVSSVISGSGSLTKEGAGTLTLSGTNTFSGGFFLNDGTVIAGSLSAFGSSSINLIGGILDLNNLAITNSILFSGGSLINAATSSSTIVISGEVTAEDINNLPGTSVSLGNGATVDLSGLTKDVVISGAPTLTNLASFTGNLAVAGALDLSSLNNRPTQANLELRTGGLLDFGSEDFSGSIDYTGGAVTGAFSGQLVVTGGQAVTLTGNSVPTGRVVVDDNQSVAIDASFTGTVLLTGGTIASGLANFSGNLELGSGADMNLTTEGNIASAILTIEEGGRLSGVGQVGTATVADGGTLAPGNSPGTQDFGTLTLLAGGSLEAEVLSVAPDGIAGIDYDTVTVSGFLDLTGLSSANRFTIDLISLLDADTVGDLVGFDPQSTFTLDLYTYTFMAANESVSNLFTVSTTQFTSGGISVGAQNFSVSDNGSAIQLVYAPIPEPSTYGLILGGLALAGAAIRRRRAKRV